MLIGSRQRLSQIISDPILSIGSESIKHISSTKTLAIREIVIRRKGFVLLVEKSILFGNAQYVEHGLVTRSGRQPNVLVYVIDALEMTTLEKIVNEVQFVQ